MEEHHLLRKQLTPHLNWNKARLQFLSLFIIGLIKAQTVNLWKVSENFGGIVQNESHYKRIQRFLRSFIIDFDQITQLIQKWVLPLGAWLLCLDRTNWQYGKTNINILVLSVAVKGVSIPILWMLLDKKGNSNTDERIILISRFLKIFDSSKIECLTADREFKGKEWLKFLKKNKIHFCIRIATNSRVDNRFKNKKLPVKRLFCLQVGESMVLNKSRTIWEQTVYLACFRTKTDWVIVICDQKPHSALKNYQKRWNIETLFHSLKTRGFNLEDTHLHDHERINKLFAVLTLSFCWCYKVGEWRNDFKPIKIKNHGRLAKSIFRYGMDWIRKLLNNAVLLSEKLKLLIALITQDKPSPKQLSYLFDTKMIN